MKVTNIVEQWNERAYVCFILWSGGH